MLGGRGKLFFTRKKVFPFPRTPNPFQKKRSIAAPLSRHDIYKFIMSLLMQ